MTGPAPPCQVWHLCLPKQAAWLLPEWLHIPREPGRAAATTALGTGASSTASRHSTHSQSAPAGSLFGGAEVPAERSHVTAAVRLHGEGGCRGIPSC